MKEDIIEKLNDFGYTANQISQLIKLENDGIVLNRILEEDTVLNQLDVSVYRQFRSLINSIDADNLIKTKIFNYFRRGINCFIVFDKKKDLEDALFVLSILEEAYNRYIDVSYLLDTKCTGKWLPIIWRDLQDNYDVSVYLDETIPEDKREIVRHGLHKGIDIGELVKEFDFIKEEDIYDLIKLYSKGYAFKDILRITNDVHSTLYVCEQKEFGIDISSCINKDMTLEVLAQIANYVNKGADMSFLKDFNIKTSTEVDLLKAIKEKSFSIEFCKGLSEISLRLVHSMLVNEMAHEDIIEIFNAGYGNKLRVAIIDCYKYNQKHYIEFLTKNEAKIIVHDYLLTFRWIMEYNYKNNKNIDVITLISNGDELISSALFEVLARAIVKDDIDFDFVIKVKDGNFSSEQAAFLIDVKKKNYNLDLFFDNRLSVAQMNAIKTCLELGLDINKNKEYDLPEKKKESKGKTYKYKTLVTKSFGNYEYVTYDNEDGCYTIMYK